VVVVGKEATMIIRPLGKFPLVVGGLLVLVTAVVALPAGAAAQPKALTTFCRAVNAVGAVPTYKLPTFTKEQAAAYDNAVVRFSQRVEAAANAAGPVETATNYAFSTDWNNTENSVSALQQDALHMVSPASSTPSAAALIHTLKKQIASTRHVLAIALAASARRGCKLK
jgi:hypothetical protein